MLLAIGPRFPVRTVGDGFCLPLVLLAACLPAGAQAAAVPDGLAVKPVISPLLATHVVPTPSGRRLVVAVAVSYVLRAPVASITTVRERMRPRCACGFPRGAR